jgi:ribose transport system ATP-binding protein
LDKADGGEVLVRGKIQNIRSAKDAVSAGIVLISEDRRREGIIPLMTVRENCALPSLDSITRVGWVDQSKEKDIAITSVERLDIKTPSIEQLIANLSGGNQQKVCVGKWLAMSPQVIIMDEPTRGIDIGAKEQIHKTIAELTRKNMAVIMISSEMQEIIGSSDRIMVLYKGRLMAEFHDNVQLTQELIMTAASGIDTYQSTKAE